MPSHWLDSSVFIEASKGPYAFDIAPGFWVGLDKLIARGSIACPLTVYSELVDAVSDDLSRWIQNHDKSNLFVPPTQAVQDTYRQIADYVINKCDSSNAARFLDGADAWLVAHAREENAIVVTMEVPANPSSKKVRIPDVCEHFEVKWINTYKMLRDLGIRLI